MTDAVLIAIVVAALVAALVAEGWRRWVGDALARPWHYAIWAALVVALGVSAWSRWWVEHAFDHIDDKAGGDRATALANGIAGSMHGALIAFAALLVVSIVLIVGTVRRSRRD